MTETVIDGETGLFFGHQTADAIVEAVEKFEKLSFDPVKIRRHAEAFSEERFADQMKSLIDTTIARQCNVGGHAIQGDEGFRR